MKLTEALDLEPDTELFTTDGVRVIFREMTTVDTGEEDHQPGTPKHFMAVTLPDGTKAALPPRSLHMPRPRP
jgi:hypothetical protein